MHVIADAAPQRTVIGRVFGRWPGPVWIAGLAIYLLVVPTGVVTEGLAQIINDVSWTIAAAAAAVASWRVAKHMRDGDRTAWLIFAAANASWSLGQIVWDVYELILHIDAPFPSIADIGYTGFGILMIVGLLALRVTQHERRFTWLRVANLGLILCGLAVLVIVMLTQPFTRSTYTLSTALILVIESVATAIACILALYLLWSYQWGVRLTSTALVTAALVAHTVAALLYTRQLIVAEYGVDSSYNIVWLVAFGLQHCAARSRLLTRTDDSVSTTRQSAAHGWVEAVLPAALLLCVSLTGIIFVNELTRSMLHFASAMLGLFAIVLAIREAFLHSQGQLVQAKLGRAAAELEQSSERIVDLDSRRAELEREIEAASLAGGVGLWDWRIANSAVKYSREWKRQLGYAEHEISDTFDEWVKRLHPDDRERAVKAAEAFVAAPHGELVQELRLQHRDGSYRWILARGSMLRDASGAPLRVLGSHIDITERKNMELSLRESEARYRTLVDELEHRVAARTAELTDAYRESRSFAYAVAHDLKAPLRAMDGFGHLLEESAADRLKLPERSYLDRIRRGALQMSALIDGLLEYSRTEHRELRIHAIDCKTCVDDVVQSMEAQIQAANARIINEVTPGEVYVDEQGVRLVLRNLLDNALKFRAPDRPPLITITTYDEESCRVVRIADNGIGFDPLYLGKIFDIFNRLHASGFEGTGIGLALVRKAVQRMHGRIWAESVPNVGSTFYVSLPRGPT